MIKEFDFTLFPSHLFVASSFNFEELKDKFAFKDEENGYVELSNKRFENWDNANGVTVSVLEKETCLNGFLVIIDHKGFPLEKIVDICSHESTHVVDRLYELIGVEGVTDTEINAYLCGWVSKCIIKTIINDNGTETNSQPASE